MVGPGGCVRDFNPMMCDCDCHKYEGVYHVVACCCAHRYRDWTRCPTCNPHKEDDDKEI